MRFFWTDIYPGYFDTLWEARSARRRAIARREVLAKPEPTIVKIEDGWLVRGALVISGSFGWKSGASSGSPRVTLIGTPLKPPRPKHRKGKRSSGAIRGRLLRRP
jgi:hypothetical protein